MQKINHWLRFIKKRPYLATAVALLLVAGAWTAFGKKGETNIETMVAHPSNFTATISIAGNVIAAQEVDLGFTQSGRVTGVYASVGQQVARGALLANIENGDERAALESARASLAQATQGTRPEEILIAETAVENDQAAVVDAINDAYRTADDAIRTKTAPLFNDPRSQYPTLTFITESSKGKKDSQESRATLEDELVDWAQDLLSLSNNSDLFAAGARAQTVLAETSLFLSAVSAALNAAVTDDSTSEDDIDAYTVAIATARANVSGAQSALTSAIAELSASEKNLALKRAGSTQNDLDVKRAEVKAAEAALAKTVITAPFSGVVTVMDAKVGEIISPSTPEISMISGGAFQIESFIPEVIIAQVAVGNAATVYLDAYGADTPFEATVVSIDPAETAREGVSTYKTILQFKEEDARIRPGMTANITVTTQQKNDTFVIPQSALIRRGGATYVEVMLSGEIEEREVTTGLSSLGQIEILAGLSDGDVVVLAPSS